jgi:uncharacterized protein YggU (UPF0235/DUF167 family)
MWSSGLSGLALWRCGVYAMAMKGIDLSHMAHDGAEIAVRVTPKASSNRIILSDGQLRIYVTVVPEDGKANAAVQKLLAKALGVPKSRLRLIRGQSARDKVFLVG